MEGLDVSQIRLFRLLSHFITSLFTPRRSTVILPQYNVHTCIFKEWDRNADNVEQRFRSILNYIHNWLPCNGLLILFIAVLHRLRCLLKILRLSWKEKFGKYIPSNSFKTAVKQVRLYLLGIQIKWRKSRAYNFLDLSSSFSNYYPVMSFSCLHHYVKLVDERWLTSLRCSHIFLSTISRKKN